MRPDRRRPALPRLLLPGMIALALALSGCAGEAPPAAVPTPPAAAPTAQPPAEVAAPATVASALVEADIATLQARMASGETTARAITEGYLARIAALDDAGPMLSAVISLAPDALAEADRLDAERAAGRVRGPLHGIPVLLKDNIDAAGLPTTAGSLALARHVPARDAFLTARLREAGAVVLGKANLSEWANFRSTRSSSGWSSAGGQTRNPYALERTPCGSSSGSAVAVAASLAAVAVGTETNGSLLCPGSVNGIVALKPTVGLVSRDGIVPISPSQDTAGPMARSVADAAALLDALAAVDPGDPASAAAPAGAAPGRFVAAASREDALRGARIGVIAPAGEVPPAVADAFARARAALEAGGATLVEIELPGNGAWNAPAFEVLLREFRPALEAYLARDAAGDAPRSLEALMAFNEAESARVMPWFGQELFQMAAGMPGLDDPAYAEARDAARRLARAEALEASFAAHDLQALVVPTTGPAWTIDWVNGDHFGFAGYGVAAVAGTPSLTLPMGEVGGLPLGVALLGRAWDEEGLLALAAGLERRLPARPVPGYATGPGAPR